MPLNEEIINELKKQGAHFITFVDISELPKTFNHQFENAILIGIILSKEFLQKVSDNPEYVPELIRSQQIHTDEFHLKEIKTDELADFTACYLSNKGYSAFSQSEDNLYLSGFYDTKTQTTRLPHKTIALMAGLGWIGKHNLLISPEFGSAVSMCTVLTDAPLQTTNKQVLESKCGNCTLCLQACATSALHGKHWAPGIKRDDMLNISACTTCLQCLVLCPYSQNYMNSIN